MDYYRTLSKHIIGGKSDKELDYRYICLSITNPLKIMWMSYEGSFEIDDKTIHALVKRIYVHGKKKNPHGR